MKVTISDIEAAYKNLKGFVHHTPLELSKSASAFVPAQVYLKFENLQKTGSFKIRGAFNKIANLTEEERKNGVVASSAGNHAQGVALSASLAKVKSTIVMPASASLSKVSATRGYGAEVILHGDIYDEAFEHAKELEKSRGLTFVHPYEDPFVIAGQGTIGIEILEAVSDLDSIIIPIGGGGLISGIATAMKKIKPSIKVYGVQSAKASSMSDLFHHQPFKNVGRISTIADGIAIKNPSKVMYDSFISKLVDDIVTVDDNEIAEAIVFLMERTKTVTEGSGAAAMAALMNRKLDLGAKTCVLLCGGNIDLNIISKIIERGQIKQGRIVRISAIVDDLPGNLNRLTQAIANQRANVLEVHHDRVRSGLFLRETQIDFVLECNSIEHSDKIKQSFIEAGAKIL
ncbi:MAG: threonine ammonia-lyase [Pseudobdellovibrionaceae bacterium]|jgi:threonine dehydratase